jgi:hypothetical protein
LILCALFVTRARAHPSSGIVVDQKGQVFLSDTIHGLLTIDAKGELTAINKEGGHWLALDRKGAFSRMEFEKSPHWPRWFKRRTPAGAVPALITDGGSPLVVSGDGNLYYVSSDEKMVPGGLQISRLSPEGKLALLAPTLREATEKLGGIKGLASGPDDSLYAACPGAIFKIKLDGTLSTFLDPVVVKDCDKDPPPDTPASQEPCLRGLDVDSRGTVYAAATGCRCVLEITPEREVKTVLKAEPPWSPTGVAVRGKEVYVLEFTNPNSAAHEEWLPRVRVLGGDGKVKTLATMSGKASESQKAKPNG